ncbi:hypothetical protein ACFLVU_03795 [Chloroflexota bacterium]
MLEIRKTAVSLDEKDLMDLERIITDNDEKEALLFLKNLSTTVLCMPSRGN